METPSVLNDRYEITSHLARGGMADVYEGRDNELNRPIAIKVLHSQFSSDEAFVKRFRREAQAAANLSHPNIVGIYDWGQSEGSTYYIIMEIVDGRSLRDVLKSEGALLPRRATEIAAETAAALSVAHQAGLVHRDVKPGNVLLAKDGTVKVTDFGIARAWDDSQELTRTGAVIGTATYFSPEQAQGASADARSDVYSLGVVLYEMLTGRPPFTGDSPMAVAFQHVSTEAAAPSSLNPDVPDSLNAVVTKALRKDPNARYQSAEEMRQDLLSVLSGENVVIPPVVPITNGNGDESATRVMTTTVPPATVPPDEVYREIEDEPRSQLPFILTAFGLLVTLGILFFVMWNLGTGGDDPELVIVRDVTGFQFEDARQLLEADGLVVVPQFENDDEAEIGEVTRTDPPADTEVEVGSTVDVFVSAGTETVAVPPVVGLSEEEARRVIEDAGLVVGDVDEEPDPNIEAGFVISSSPVAGQEISPAIPVDLVVSSGPEVVVLPDVTGMSERDATAELNGLGLRVAVNEEYDDDVADGDVIRSEPEAGQEVLSGDTILLVVSLGPEPVPVPDLSGMTEQQATNALNEVGLVIRVANTTQPVADPNQDGLVVDQVPSPGATANQGDTVTVTLGEYTPPPTTTTTTTTTTVPPTTTP